MQLAAEEQLRRGNEFRDLHVGDTAFVMPNPWDAGSARLLLQLGFPALATTSAGLSFMMGKPDGENRVTRAEALDNARSIVAATDLPVSADLESCYAGSAGGIAGTIRLGAEAGLVGCSIEDAAGDPADPPGAEAIRAVCTAVDRPVNVLAGAAHTLSVDELRACGVHRISLGSALVRAALGAVLRAAREVREQGTFSFTSDALPYAEANALMSRWEQ